MKIGIIGTGSIGANAARLLIRAGHEVALSNSRGVESLEPLVAELGEAAKAMTVEQAAKFGDVVLVAIPFGKYNTLPADAFSGKIVIDATNYYPLRDTNFPDLDSKQTTSSELLALHLRGAKLVKAFNTIYYQHLASQGNTSLPLEERRVIFIAGDDAQAKEIVTQLIEEIGFAVYDTGSLHEGGQRQEPETAIYNKTLTTDQAKEILATA
jgi:predicted dinucleotide-binding enzyme